MSQSKPKKYLYDVFLSHNWGGKDANGVTNHQRVKIINRELKKMGYTTWFDDERMQGNLASDMSSGIEKSRVVLVFVTKAYAEKVAGLAQGGKSDNCFIEFDYSCTKHAKNETIIPIVMEREMCNSGNWEGPLGLHLGRVMHYRMIMDMNDKALLADGMADIANAIDRKLKRKPDPERQTRSVS